MNKKNLIREIANRTGFSIRVSKIVIDCLFKNISSALKQGDRITLKDFGAFYNVDKQDRRYYDIHTGTIKTYPKKKAIKFVTYKKFKEQLSLDLLDIHTEDDGSVGNRVVVGKHIYSNTKNKRKEIKPVEGKENISKREIRRSTEDTANLIFDGQFLFDSFLGENDHKEYPSLKVPQKGTPILIPQKDKTGATIGVMEPVLQAYLKNLCEEIDGIEIFDDTKLPIANRNYPYRPDCCLYWAKKKLYIDIEIDEPYDIVSRKPIHYQGNGDNLRDRYFIRNGWCVIRFSEQQVKENIEDVINYVKRVLRWLTNESEIKIHKNTLSFLSRWTYEEATTMASNNIREHYLNLPDYAPDSNQPTEDNNQNNVPNTSVFVKPDEDILPEIAPGKNFKKWKSIVDELKLSEHEYCILTRANGYQWIYTCKTLHILSENGVYNIDGESPLGISRIFPLTQIKTLAPLTELFSNVCWDGGSSAASYNELKEILFDAIANGKPIWIAYNSNTSGYSERFLSNIVYNRCIMYKDAPHIGLGHCVKHGIQSLTHFYAYCSKRKEFRSFAADGRVEKLKVLNCRHVYFFDEIYANSFANLIMSPYVSSNGNAFFENAEEILRVMPKNEFDSAFVQGNLANLQVMKGDIENAILTYKQKPFDSYVNSILWGEVCINDIKFFIDLCKEHLNDSYFYDGLDANILLKNFEEVLRQLTQSSWMQDYNG